MTPENPLEIAPEALADLRRTGSGPALLDVREPWEYDLCALRGSRHIPMGELAERLGELPAAETLVVICHHGARSLQAVRWLRAQGIAGAVSLRGGIDLWARTVDPALPRY